MPSVTLLLTLIPGRLEKTESYNSQAVTKYLTYRNPSVRHYAQAGTRDTTMNTQRPSHDMHDIAMIGAGKGLQRTELIQILPVILPV